MPKPKFTNVADYTADLDRRRAIVGCIESAGCAEQAIYLAESTDCTLDEAKAIMAAGTADPGAIADEITASYHKYRGELQ